MRSFLQKNGKIYPKIYKYKKIIIIIIAGILVLAIINLLKDDTKTVRTSGFGDERIDAPATKAKQDLNQNFSFTIGENKIDYVIENAQLQDEIILKGQIAKSVKGKTFLILNLKIRNNTNKLIQVNTRDYVRLSMNDDKNEKIALEIHNDPVSVQPISTKLTRLALPIKDSDKNLVLHVGEIEGGKRNITLKF